MSLKYEVEYTNEDNVPEMQYLRYGKLHRMDGPAYVYSGSGDMWFAAYGAIWDDDYDTLQSNIRNHKLTHAIFSDINTGINFRRPL